MSIKTTHLITREAALLVIQSKIHEASNEELAEMLEAFPESKFRNYNVVSQQEFDEDEEQEYPMPKINSVSGF